MQNLPLIDLNASSVNISYPYSTDKRLSENWQGSLGLYIKRVLVPLKTFFQLVSAWGIQFFCLAMQSGSHAA